MAAVDRFGRSSRAYTPAERDALVNKILVLLRAGSRTLISILNALEPPLAASTVAYWRQVDVDIANALDEAFDIGMDQMALDRLNIADGVTAEGERHTRSSVKRDRLRLQERDKIMANWSLRYANKQVHANDPDNPLNPTTKAADLSLEQLLAIAAQGVTVKVEAAPDTAKKGKRRA